MANVEQSEQSPEPRPLNQVVREVEDKHGYTVEDRSYRDVHDHSGLLLENINTDGQCAPARSTTREQRDEFRARRAERLTSFGHKHEEQEWVLSKLSGADVDTLLGVVKARNPIVNRLPADSLRDLVISKAEVERDQTAARFDNLPGQIQAQGMSLEHWNAVIIDRTSFLSDLVQQLSPPEPPVQGQ